jgi:FtsH-binding integral membrane protein
MKKQILKLLATFLATIIVMVGTFLVIYFMKQDMSIVSFLVGCLGFVILSGALKQWEDRFKSLFNMTDEKEV